MIIIGLTGSVGMGKSEASKYFLKNNIDVFDCDKEIASLYKKKEVVKEIKLFFPSTIIKNKVDTGVLANIVFNNDKKLRLLEKYLHNKLRAKQCLWLRKKARQRKRVLVFDVPLLFEKDNIKKYDTILLLSCVREIQNRRVLIRKGWDKERLEKTIKKQMPDNKKQALADITIKTDRGKRYLYEEVIKTIKEMKNKQSRNFNNILKEF